MDRDEGEVSNNNDDGDGLAALFGGITPSAEPPSEPGPRRAAPVDPAPDPEPAPPPAYQPPVSQPPVSQPPVSQPQGDQPPAYQPPAYSPPVAAPSTPVPAWPASTAYDLPAPAAAPQAPAPYDLPPPAAPPAVAPAAAPFGSPPPAYDPSQSPGGSPPQYEPPSYEPPSATPPQYDSPSYAPLSATPPQYDPQQYEPPPSEPPQSYAPPSEEPRSYEPPPSREAPSYDLPAPGDVAYSGAPPAGPSYPPTVQYPAGLDPTFAAPAGPSYDFSASAPAAAQPTPLDEPPPYGAPAQSPPPTLDGPYGAPPSYEGYAPSLAHPEPSPGAEPGEQSAAEHPLVRAEPALPAAVFPAGPLLPSATVVETPEYLERSTGLEKVGLVLAVIAGPIGLLMAIVNAARSARRRGWLIGIVRASLVLAVLSSIAAGIAGYVLWNVRLDQIAHAETAAASAEFCAAAEVDPTMVAPPTLGWPAQGASVGESITTMQTWTDRWAALAASSPAKLRTGIELLADTGQAIVDSVTQARVVDDATNQAKISAIADQSGVAAWHSTYCVAP
jgi:hypothetical protein